MFWLQEILLFSKTHPILNFAHLLKSTDTKAARYLKLNFIYLSNLENRTGVEVKKQLKPPQTPSNAYQACKNRAKEEK